MAQCLYCGKKGWFLSVSELGLCKSCEPGVMFSVNRTVEIIKESQDIIEKTKKFETAIGRYDLIIGKITDLKDRYYSKGIKVLTKDPDELIEAIKADKANAIDQEAHNQVEKYLTKAELAKTLNSKINNANKALLLLKDFEDKYGYKNLDLENKVKYFIFRAELDDYIDKAERAEFKEQTKKAMDLYMDALYLIKNSEFDEEGIEKHIESALEKLKKKSS